MNLQIGVKEVYTKNVTQTHNYKENVFFLLFLQLQLLKKKPYVQKKGHGGKTETNVQSHNRLSVRRLEMKSADRFSVLVLRRTECIFHKKQIHPASRL